MDGRLKSLEGGGQSLSLEEVETDDPSPYDSDTEDVDVDKFVKSLPHDANQWCIYKVEDFGLEKIGDGFFGDIFKATEVKTNKVMVMKMMKKSSKMKQMCAEIRLMCRLKHPNILRFLGVCIDSFGVHLLTEYMAVGNLEDVVADAAERLPWSLRMKLAHDISKGMAYLHAVGVIHRDLASKNILISNESGLYLAVVGDFGLAAKIPSRQKKLKVVGSPFWMAPEVLRHDQYNETVDIFSYGIILCEIIGRVHSSPEEIPRTNQYGLDVDKFRKHVEGCPPEFLQLAVCCCQVDPQSRPAFEVTSNFLEYIRHLTSVEGSTSVTPDGCRGDQRMSANIEDWIIDSKKGMEPLPAKTFHSYKEEYDGENVTSVVSSGTNGIKKKPEEGKTDVNSPTHRPAYLNSRNSFFAAFRYKHFRPSVETEDLVKNTPSKLAGFFNRVLHVQKKHKFDGRRKKTRTRDESHDVLDRPRLRSFRLFASPNKETSHCDFGTMPEDNTKFDKNIENVHELFVIRDDEDNCSDSTGKFLPPSERPNILLSDVSLDVNKRLSQSSSSASSCAHVNGLPTVCSQAPDEDDDVDFSGYASSSETDNQFSMSWPHSVSHHVEGLSNSTDVNGVCELKTKTPRSRSESDLCAGGDKPPVRTRTCSVQGSKVTKHRKYWSFVNFFRKRGNGKHHK